jgi:HRDC domain/RTX calcium-binding nonapeptide repeat (4 copies)/RecQ zinc-binding
VRKPRLEQGQTDSRNPGRLALANRARLIVAAVALIALGFSVAPARAAADVSCFRAGTDLTVNVTEGFVSRLAMNPPFIEVFDFSGEIACGGDPTTANVDTVLVNDNSTSGFDTTSEIDLSGGPFAPGAADEPSSTSDEIEFGFTNMEKVNFTGTAGVDGLDFGAAGANVNVGAEGGIFSDVDVTFTGLDTVRVDAGGSADAISGQGAAFIDSPFPLPLTLVGEAGGDELTGGDADDNIGLTTDPGDDTLAGGAGNDLLVANVGNDDVNGGPGSDRASYLNAAAAVTVDLAVGAEQNTGGGGLDTLTAIENLIGTQSGDTLRGDAGPNRLEGFGGGDTIEGRAGPDFLLGDNSGGDAGNDVILARDGIADTISCLAGTDSVTADLLGVDSVPADCETVSFLPSSQFSFGKLKRNKKRGTARNAARDRAWRAYRAVEAFSFSDRCRRRMLLDHFGDDTPGAPEGRCCDACAADSWLPDPAQIQVAPSRGRRGAGKREPAELAPEDERLFESLREWRMRAAAGKPAYTVANNRTLEGIAASRPRDRDGLAEVHGVGPAFIERHADEVLELVAAA